MMDTEATPASMTSFPAMRTIFTHTQPQHKCNGVAIAIRLYNRLVQEDSGRLLNAIDCGHSLQDRYQVGA
jgi:hypothetical protein